jgi:ankyrin repeat protein
LDFETQEKDSELREKKHFRLDINKKNEKCLNATPLHLAVWNDNMEIALSLIRANADPYMKMNDSNAFDLAKDRSNQVLYELLVEFSTNNIDNIDKNNKNS